MLSKKLATVDKTRCVACGVCENTCPLDVLQVVPLRLFALFPDDVRQHGVLLPDGNHDAGYLQAEKQRIITDNRKEPFLWLN